MTGLDTNVLVRYIMQDDARQSAVANRFVESLSAESPGFVSLIGVIELAWVLSSAYRLDKEQVVEAFEGLLRTKELVVERAPVVWSGLRVYKDADAELADCLLERSAKMAGCDNTVTLDRGVAKNCSMTLLV